MNTVPATAIAEARQFLDFLQPWTVVNRVLALPYAPRPHAPRSDDLPPLSAKEPAARRALRELEQCIGRNQRRAVLQCFNGEEREWFFYKILSLHQLIATMPKTYEQDGKGDQAIVYLHYFAGLRVDRDSANAKRAAR